MGTKIIKIHCQGEPGNMYSKSMAAFMNKAFILPRGNYLITIDEIKQYNKRRYKYYFGHIILTAVVQFNQRGLMQVRNKNTGKVQALDSKRLHRHFKRLFNPVLEETNGDVIEVAGSTTELTDSEFINEYLEKIMAWLAERDVIVMNYDEWNEQMRTHTALELANTIIV